MFDLGGSSEPTTALRPPELGIKKLARDASSEGVGCRPLDVSMGTGRRPDSRAQDMMPDRSIAFFEE